MFASEKPVHMYKQMTMPVSRITLPMSIQIGCWMETTMDIVILDKLSPRSSRNHRTCLTLMTAFWLAVFIVVVFTFHCCNNQGLHNCCSCHYSSRSLLLSLKSSKFFSSTPAPKESWWLKSDKYTNKNCQPISQKVFMRACEWTKVEK